MTFTNLDLTDLNVSRLCMGTMTFGSQADFSESKKMVDLCLDRGINFFDTANVYNQGKSEEILGRALGSKRNNIILASKVRGKMQGPPEYGGLSREAVRQAANESLKRLGTDYLDIYYLHQPDYDTPIEETLDVMEELRREGKIRYVGTSNYSAWQMCEIFWLCEKNGYQPPWVAQPMYNLLARGIEQEYLPFTKRFPVSNVCYNPLAGGLLTGKQSSSAPLPGTRFDGNEMYLNRYWRQEYFSAVEELKEIASQAKVRLLEMAFSWLLQREGVDCIILGASRAEQLEQNLQAAEGLSLPSEILEACDRVWAKLRGPTPQYNR